MGSTTGTAIECAGPAPTRSLASRRYFFAISLLRTYVESLPKCYRFRFFFRVLFVLLWFVLCFLQAFRWDCYRLMGVLSEPDTNLMNDMQVNLDMHMIYLLHRFCFFDENSAEYSITVLHQSGFERSTTATPPKLADDVSLGPPG